VTEQQADSFAAAHALLAELIEGDYRNRTEDRDDPSTVQAMQLALNLPKQDPPARNQVLTDAARAVVAVCLDERAGSEGFWREHLAAWYSHRIRKVARRARNKAWDNVQVLPGVTVGTARAFVPSATNEVPPAIAKLQIKGTELEDSTTTPIVTEGPLLLIDASLTMSLGKAAAQVGHASMLYAAALPLEKARAWAKTGFVLSVREVDPEAFAKCSGHPNAVVVRDAGYTEVAPGSVTVVALPPGTAPIS